jgi:hypothetical protein
MTRATIKVHGKNVNWQYDNRWQTRWSLRSAEGTLIEYAGSSTGGQAEANTDDELLLLTGLFVTNYYWQMTILVVIITVFIPVWITVLN